jgi:hypothetical protein
MFACGKGEKITVIIDAISMQNLDVTLAAP